MAINANLWNGYRIPIIMISGPVNSGKTLFGLTIDPTCRLPASVTPATIHWDQEGSADSYAGALNFDHKDTRAAVAAGVHMQAQAADALDPAWRKMLLENPDVKDSPSMSMFRAWYLSLLKVPAGKYAVGICDTFTPLQEGLIEWMRRHPAAFGRTAAQYDKASSMFLWPDLKSVLAHILATDCRTRFDTFVINVHLKKEWTGGAPTGKHVAEGLDVLEKLATLHIELDRTPKEKGKEAPRVPSGLVKKQRLVRFGATGGDDLPILPPRLPEATPDAIRAYIAAPPDFAKLKVEERLPDTSLSDDEKLRLSATMAENNRVAEEAKLNAMELAAKAAREMRSGVSPFAQPETTQSTSGTATMATAIQVSEMISLFKELFPDGKAARAWLLSGAGTDNPQLLTDSEAQGVMSKLFGMKAERQAAANVTPAPTAAAGPTAEKVTVEQRAMIRDMTVRLYGAQAGEENAKFLSLLGIGAAMGLTSTQANARITELERAMMRTNPPPAAGADLPFA